MKTGPRGAAVPIHRMGQKPPEETMEGTRDAGSEVEVCRLVICFSKGCVS